MALSYNVHPQRVALRRNVDSISSSLSCYTDCAEVVGSILAPEVVAIINEYADLIEYIYVTDIHPKYLK